MSNDQVTAYDASGGAWKLAVEPVYARFATVMLQHSPVPLVGAEVLDIGAGTAVASDIALRLGARRAVACDLAPAMLRHRRPDVPAVLADAGRLPFADGCFDLAIAACCLGHLPDPVAGLSEARRVAGHVLATAFVPEPSHPAKVAVDEAMTDFGFVEPDWYTRLKREVQPQVDDPQVLAAMADRVGFRSVQVVAVQVDVGLATPAAIAGWRLGMAHLAPFVADLPETERAAARRAAELAVTGMAPIVVGLLVLSAS